MTKPYLNRLNAKATLPGILKIRELISLAERKMFCVIDNKRAGYTVNEKIQPTLDFYVYQGYAFPILNILVPHVGHVP